MRALCWHGKSDVRCDTVHDPKIEDPRDVIIKITSCAICGSDLHLYDGYMPTMESGDVLGHENMGEVVEVGRGHSKFKVGRVPERLAMAEKHGKAETIDFSKDDVYDRLMEMTNGRGADRCIDAVGAEAHGTGSPDAMLDKVKAAAYLATDRPRVLRETIMCCRKGGTISVPGVYIGVVDKLPFGAFMNKALTFRTGQTHTHRYLEPLLKLVQDGKVDPTFVITHRAGLDEGPDLYKTFRDKEDGCIKVVLKP